MATSPPADGGLRDELRSDASTITDSGKQRLQAEVDSRKGVAAEQTRSLSSALDAAAGKLDDSPTWLRSAFEQGAHALQRFADTIDNKNSRELTRDVQQLARENPGTFLAGCAAAGFAAARVLKAGVDEPARSGAYGAPSDGSYDPYRQPQSAADATAFGGLAEPAAAGQPAYQGGI